MTVCHCKCFSTNVTAAKIDMKNNYSFSNNVIVNKNNDSFSNNVTAAKIHMKNNYSSKDTP
jgi:hypothetical protein